MKKIEFKVEEVKGYCSRDYKKGDNWIVEGFDTPNKFCGGAYATLFPIVVSFMADGKFTLEKDPMCKTGMACPDNGNIIFSIKQL